MRISGRGCGSITLCPNESQSRFMSSLCRKRAYQRVGRDSFAFGDLVFVVLMRLGSRDKQGENGGGLDALA